MTRRIKLAVLFALVVVAGAVFVATRPPSQVSRKPALTPNSARTSVRPDAPGEEHVESASPNGAKTRETPLPQSTPDQGVEDEDFLISIEDVARLSPEQRRAWSRNHWMYTKEDFRTADPTVAEAYESRLQAAVSAIPAEERNDWHFILENSLSNLNNLRRRDAVRREKFFEGKFLLDFFHGVGDNLYEENREQVANTWAQLVELLGTDLAADEKQRVGELFNDTARDVADMREEYLRLSTASRAGPAIALELEMVSENLLERDLSGHYDEWERELKKSLTKENFEVMEELLRSLGLREGSTP